jgi:hypothetical protein
VAIASTFLVGCSRSTPDVPNKEEIEMKKQWQEKKSSEQNQQK